MKAIFSGISMLISFLAFIFWAGEDGLWLLDMLFQTSLFVILGRLVFSCTFFLAVFFRSERPLIMGAAFMISIFFRWMLRMALHFDVGDVFPLVRAFHGIPYTILCSLVSYVALSLFWHRQQGTLC